MKKLLTSDKPGYETWSRWFDTELGKFIKTPFFLMTTLRYRESANLKPVMSGSWRIDQMKVTILGTMSESEQEAYCFKYLAKAFTKALARGRRVTSKNWSFLERYPEYYETQKVLDSMHYTYHTEEQGKEPEELLFLERKT